MYPHPVSLEPPLTTYDHSAGQGRVGTLYSSKPDMVGTWVPSTLQVRPSSKDGFKSAQSEQLLLTLSPADPLAYEVVARGDEVHLQVAGSDEDIQAAQKQLSAHYPWAEVSRGPDLVGAISPHIQRARSYRLRESYLFPIRTGHTVEPYAVLLGILDGLTEEECALFQVLFVPVRNDWAGNIRRLSRDPWDPSKSPFIDLPQLPKTADNKVAAPLFAVAVRLAASSHRLLDRMEGSFLSLFTSG